MTLNVLKIIPDTIVDGPGMRTSIYISGCTHHCPGCHNQSSWKESSGRDMTFEEIKDLIIEYDHNKITISGGDGLCYQANETIEFLKYLRTELSNLNIWLYTGYLIEDLLNDPIRKKVLPLVDVLCDGPFIESQKSTEKLWVGSLNQRVINVQESLKKGEVTLL